MSDITEEKMSIAARLVVSICQGEVPDVADPNDVRTIKITGNILDRDTIEVAMYCHVVMNEGDVSKPHMSDLALICQDYLAGAPREAIDLARRWQAKQHRRFFAAKGGSDGNG